MAPLPTDFYITVMNEAYYVPHREQAECFTTDHRCEVLLDHKFGPQPQQLAAAQTRAHTNHFQNKSCAQWQGP